MNNWKHSKMNIQMNKWISEQINEWINKKMDK